MPVKYNAKETVCLECDSHDCHHCSPRAETAEQAVAKAVAQGWRVADDWTYIRCPKRGPASALGLDLSLCVTIRVVVGFSADSPVIPERLRSVVAELVNDRFAAANGVQPEDITRMELVYARTEDQ